MASLGIVTLPDSNEVGNMLVPQGVSVAMYIKVWPSDRRETLCGHRSLHFRDCSADLGPLRLLPTDGSLQGMALPAHHASLVAWASVRLPASWLGTDRLRRVIVVPN